MRAVLFRKFVSILLMAIGIAMLIRGLSFAMRQNLGFQGIIMASIAGGIVFALGFIRYRYLCNR
jgi:uncharacterized protein (DUF697 family)